MFQRLRIVLAASGAAQFAALAEACGVSGYQPVAYVVSRSMRPKAAAEPWAAAALPDIVTSAPHDVDVLLPASSAGLARQLVGYRPDLLVAHGFNWRLSRQVRAAVRFGALNVHLSPLPKYRGPAPVLAALRAGDPYLSLTIHRMDDGFDTGPILVRRDGIELVEWPDPAGLWGRTAPVLQEALGEALAMVLAGEPGREQDESAASYAGFVEPEFVLIDWGRSAFEVHNQVRMFAYLGRAPIGVVDGMRLAVMRTSLVATDGLRVECADAPIWITRWEPSTDQPPES